MSLFANWNGKIVREEEVAISPNNRSFRYGDGCFETIKVINGNIPLHQLHFDRLFSSLDTLCFTIPSFLTTSYLIDQITALVLANGHSSFARVRLVLYRGDGGLYDVEDHSPNFIIQSWAGNTETNRFNQQGLVVDFFSDAIKTADRFSYIKSNNFLGYIMAALRAKQNKLDDAILLNAHNSLADATIANVFIVSAGIIKTPSISQGCVSGVMRKYLLNCFKKEGLPFYEVEIFPDELLNASEVFLTNSIYGIRWVQKVQNSNYSNSTSSRLYQKFVAPLFQTSTI
ncbi:MAG: hypothetical protein JWQ40_2299 [Segetibacter sp.]|nr:hypothetical protein [Segetibacter sp.]